MNAFIFVPVTPHSGDQNHPLWWFFGIIIVLFLAWVNKYPKLLWLLIPLICGLVYQIKIRS